MTLELKPIVNTTRKRPILIAGPCSAESEAQVLETAKGLIDHQIDFFRAGIWKPRTRPNSFEGVGTIGLKWLKQVKKEFGLKVITEVANQQHVYQALKYGIDALWIGARTTVNPFSVQEIADAIEGVDIPVFIKNPINPDLNLWIGAIERMHKAGIHQIAAIHRGFSSYGNSNYRNAPMWQIPIELKRQFPDLPIICDNSHICGRRDTLQRVAQKAMDLNFEGLMTETHPDPDQAWSDAKQQIKPSTYKDMMKRIIYRNPNAIDTVSLQDLDDLRLEIDHLDNELLDLLGKRMMIADDIGQYKKCNNMAILQPSRWEEILKLAIQKGAKKGLSEQFIASFLKAVHQESINHQEKVMN